MRRRLAALLRARFSSATDAGLPWAAVVMQFLVAGVLCGLVRDELAPYPYLIFALSVAGLLVAVPLLGEAGTLLFADEARPWIASLPVRPIEIEIARRLHAVTVLGVLSLGSALPAAVFAPTGFSLSERLVVVGATLALTLPIAAFLLALLGTLGGRANSVLVVLQTGIFMLLVAGSVLGLPAVFALADVTTFEELPALARWLPPAWFAIALAEPATALPIACAATALLASLLALAFAPAPRTLSAQRGGEALAFVLAPLRRLSVASWVRPKERAAFEFVFDALPKEPEFALRTYPLLGIPLAFLFAGADESTGASRDALFALLLFTPGAYLPLLAAQLPGSRSHRARWLFDTAPTAPAALANGAFKALCVRFVVPLWCLLALFCAAQGGLGLALRWTPPALLLAFFVLRRSFGLVASDPPLSRSPDELQADNGVFSGMLAFGLLLTFAAVAAVKLLTTWPAALAATLLLLTLELAADRRLVRASQPPGIGSSAT